MRVLCRGVPAICDQGGIKDKKAGRGEGDIILRIMGLDIGEKRIGVAVSDEYGLIAQGLPTVNRTGTQEDIRQLADIAQKWSVEKIVAGMPRNMNGSYGPQSDLVFDFISRLQQETEIEVICQDERLTTAAARRTLLEGDVSRQKRKKAVDKIAAVLILQSFLDRQGYLEHGRTPDSN